MRSRLKEASLDDVCLLVTDGTHDTPKRVKDGFPLIKAKEIVGRKIDFETCDRISEKEHLRVIARSKPEYGDTLFAHIGASLGEAAFVNTNRSFSIKNIALFKPNPAIINQRYLFYLITSPAFQELAKRTKTGSAQPFLSLGKLRAHRITYHQVMDEQRKIAAILSEVDNSIEKSDEIITKTQQLRTGLMQQLLTKGIGHTRFKQTELGEIPEEWEVVYFRQIITSYRNGIYKPSSFYGRGIPSVRMYNIDDGKVNKAKAPLLDVTKPEAKSYGLLPGDILINRVNSIDQVGKAGIVQDDLGDAIFESKNIRVRVSPDRCDPHYLAYFLCTSLYLKQIRSRIKPAVSQATINQDDLDQIQICMPPLSEQQEIASILSTLDEKIETEMQRKEEVEHLKKGLVSDLLTGKVRVKVT